MKGILLEFESQLKDSTACVVIGFSFRDRYINKYFLELAEKGIPVIIVLPPGSINQAIQNLLPNEEIESTSEIKDYLSLPKHMIYFIPQYFQIENLDNINSTISKILQSLKRMLKMQNEVGELLSAAAKDEIKQ